MTQFKQKLIKGLSAFLLAGALFFPRESKGQERVIINNFSQPNDTTLNYYGSGDVFLDKTIDWKDAYRLDSIIDGTFTDPLDDRFRKLGMINNLSKDTIYLNCCAEKIPLLNSYFDIVFSRNCLDHTNNPQKIIFEMSRLLKRKGTILLSTDINHVPTKTEPLKLTIQEIERWLKDAKIDILLKKIDTKTYNFKKGKRVIIKGIKND